MNSRNLQIKGAKAIGLPPDWGHMLRLILATFAMEDIKKTSQIVKSKIRPKIPPKIMKKKNMTEQGRR
jgi:hypothetical protein